MKKLFAGMCLVLLLGAIAQNLTAQSWSINGPLPRWGHSAVFAQSASQMIVFGGAAGDTNLQQNNLNDVWRLSFLLNQSGAAYQWVQVHPSGAPPAPRYGPSAGYDPGSKRMIIFGGAEGHSSPCTNDSWVLTNAAGGSSSWIQLSPAGGPPAARWGQAGTYDPISNTLIIFGGNDCFSTFFTDVWVLSNANGVSGTPTWTQLSTSGGPAPRFEVGAVYDSTSNELIVFGGQGNGTYFNDVWVLSNANGSGGTPVWTQLFPTGTPPAVRGYVSATYDPTTNRMTIFGGTNTGGKLGDTWVLINANGVGGTPAWMQIAASSTYFPYAREAHTAVYWPATNEMVIFGGDTTGVYFNDVFFLSHANGQ